MTASVSHKGKIGRVASMALATVLSASFVAATVAPVAANDFHYDEPFDNQPDDQQVLPANGSRSVYRDDTGRFFIQHGRKQYIQYWDAEPQRPRPLPTEDRRRDRDKNLETAIIAGVAGLAIGAIIAGSQPRQQHIAPIVNSPRARPLPRHAFPDAPINHRPRVITYEGAFEPWTQSWANWCSDRYRSFNISNGTYKGYDGVSRFCVVK